ncbi:Ergosterol biosynthetic protein [Trifolium repens]|nr:Ergosterol biosynthetic protein [Trifolium repens]
MVVDSGWHTPISLRVVRFLRLAVFSNTTMTEVHGRTFGTWTLLTCTLCYICAFNLDNKPIYLATLLSFVYAFGHFLTENLIYHTMAISNLTTVSVFAGTSIVWMLLQWNTHLKVRSKPSNRKH